MKRLLTVLVLAFIMIGIYGQRDSINYKLTDSLKCAPEFKISIAPTIGTVLYYRFVAGGPGRKFKPGFSASFDYSFRSDNKINFGFGLNYQFAQVEYTPNMDSGDFTGQTDNVILISFNFATIYNLKKNFYLSLNPLINLQLNYRSDLMTKKQTGLGLSFSVGKKFFLNNNIQLNIEPKLWINNIVPFNPDGWLKHRLTALGLNFGFVFGQNLSH